jgi:hypothetical protein
MMVHHLIARPVTGHRNQRHDPEISARSFFGRCLNLDDSVQHRGYRAKLPLRQAPRAAAACSDRRRDDCLPLASDGQQGRGGSESLSAFAFGSSAQFQNYFVSGSSATCRAAQRELV